MKYLIEYVNYELSYEYLYEAKNFTGGAIMIKLEMPKWHLITDVIKEEDIYKNMNIGTIIDGVQTIPHVTLLYPVNKSVRFEEIKYVLDKLFADMDLMEMDKVINLSTDRIDFFALNNYDVLTIRVNDNPILTKISEVLKSKIRNYTKLKEFHPHITIAYLKKGTADKYCQPYVNKIDRVDTITYEVNKTIFKYSI